MRGVIEALERDPLRNIVLLKHLEAFPDHTTLHRVERGGQAATLVLLDVAASAYDRRTYPSARHAALISSDDPGLTREALAAVPRGDGVVFKLSSEHDHAVVAGEFAPLQRTTSVLSFTAASSYGPDARVRVSTTPTDAMYAAFGSQKHDKAWLEPLLQSGRAFTCAIERDGAPLSVCFAFENHKRIWEIGGVCTPADARGRGYASSVVRTALAELAGRGLVARYQVHDDNVPSIRLAEAIGLRRFLEITHFLHEPGRTTR